MLVNAEIKMKCDYVLIDQQCAESQPVFMAVQRPTLLCVEVDSVIIIHRFIR